MKHTYAIHYSLPYLYIFRYGLMATETEGLTEMTILRITFLKSLREFFFLVVKAFTSYCRGGLNAGIVKGQGTQAEHTKSVYVSISCSV